MYIDHQHCALNKHSRLQTMNWHNEQQANCSAIQRKGKKAITKAMAEGKTFPFNSLQN